MTQATMSLEEGSIETGTAVAVPADESVSSLVRLAIERGVDVGILERLVALQERVAERDARAAFFEALAGFQDECPEIPKSSKAEIATKSGARYSYTYAPLEAITRAIRPALRKHGLSYSWDVEQGDGALIVICILRHVEGHQERASFPVPIDAGARMSPAQANGAALTYGRRQSLVAVLGLTTADDTDAGTPVDDTKITDAQVADLTALCDEVGADRTKFLRFMGVDAFEGIRALDYKRAVEALERKR